MTLDDLEAELGLPRRKITSVICTMVTAKFVVREEKGCYRSTRAGATALAKGYTSGPHKPHTGTRAAAGNTYRQRLWTTLRRRRVQSTPDLVANARGPKDGDKQVFDNAYQYLRLLASAGIVAKLEQKAPGTTLTSNGYAVWRLVKDLGPMAPVARPTKRVVFDPNSGECIVIQAVKL